MLPQEILIRRATPTRGYNARQGCGAYRTASKNDQDGDHHEQILTASIADLREPGVVRGRSGCARGAAYGRAHHLIA